MKDYQKILHELAANGSLRSLPHAVHQGKWIEQDGQRMLNLSSNDYLGLANDRDLRNEFLDWLRDSDCPLSSSSSRLLTGNFTEYEVLEQLLAETFGREAALVFNSGYHANTGILPALADKQTLLVADKLVHASIKEVHIHHGCTVSLGVEQQCDGFHILDSHLSAVDTLGS